jgi:hypothetical protein
MCPQRLASRRLNPIRAPSETRNRMAAAVNVGAATGEKAGTATCDWRIMNTLKQFSWFGEMSKKIRAVVLLGGSLSV